MKGLSQFVLRHKTVVAALWVAIFLAGIYSSSKISDRFSTEFSLPGREGYEANVAIVEKYGNGANTNPIVSVITLPEGTTIDSPGINQQLEGVFSSLDERGLRVVSYPQTRDDAFIIDGGRTVFGIIFTPPVYGDNEDQAKKELGNTVQNALERSLPSGSQVRVTGLAQLADVSGEEQSGDSGALIETLVGGVGALIILLFVFGSLLALMPLIIAAVSILATFVALLGLTYTTDVVNIVQYVVTLIGLGVAIDYSLLLVTRWREERGNGYDKVAATHRAMTTAGRAIVFSGLTVAIGLLVLVLLPVPFMRSLGFGSVLIPLMSVATSITLLPVLLATLGDRFAWPRRGRATMGSRLWSRWANGVVKRPWVATFIALALLVPLCLAALGMRVGYTSSDSLSQTGPARAALTTLQNNGVPTGVLTPIEVLVPADRSIDSIVDELNNMAGVYRAVAPESWQRGDVRLISVLPEKETMTTEGQQVVARVQQTVSGFAGVRVGGEGALLRAEIDALYGTFPLMLLLIGLITFVLLIRAFRSIVLALQAIVLNLLSIGAAYGVLVLVWQKGYGSELVWGIPALGSVTTWVPVITFAFLFGLSMDYQVFLLTRMREEYDRTGSTRQAIVTGLGRVARLVTSAALILFLALLALSAIPEIDVKVMATGLGAAILIDATVLRMLLVPALTRLTGKWTWWLPAWVARVLRVPASPLRAEHEPQ